MSARRFLAVMLLATIVFDSRSHAQTTTRVSVDSAGGEVLRRSGFPALSADGRYVAFESFATTLITGDTNNVSDLFVHDRTTGFTTRIGLGPNGAEPDDDCFASRGEDGPAMSADGRFVAFSSSASNLVPADANGRSDVFVWDQQTATTLRVSVSTAGVEGDGESLAPAISADGRFVVFSSGSSNLASGDTNFAYDVFVRDRDRDGNRTFDEPAGVETRRVSVSSSGAQGDTSSGVFGGNRNGISADGRWIAFSGASTTFVPNDTNSCSDVFVHDLFSGTTERVSVNDAGVQGDIDSTDPAISADGRWVAFTSRASNLTPTSPFGGFGHLYVRDRLSGVTTLEDVDSSGQVGTAVVGHSLVSADGRFVVFDSESSNLVSNDFNGQHDTFRHDRQSGATIRVSVANDGREGISSVSEALGLAMTPDANVVAFGSWFSNLIFYDTNTVPDVFVRELVVPLPVSLASVSPSFGFDGGGDVVRLFGSNLPSGAGTIVRFGNRSATLLEAAPDHLTLRTPPGTGTVDVSVFHSRGVATLPLAFTFVSRDLLARYGNVNFGRGERENVLLVNLQSGDDHARELTVRPRTPISVILLSPSSRQSASYALFVWPGAPSATTLTRQPARVGFAVFPTTLNPGRLPQPLVIANNWDPRLGAGRIQGAPAPTIVASRSSGVPRPLTFTLQAIIQDDASISPVHASLSNAVIVHAVPHP